MGRGERGTGGLAALTAATPHSIAYLEHGQAARLGVPYASIQNQAGVFVQPEARSFEAGLAEATWDPAKGFVADTTNLTSDGAYPMTVVTYALVPIDRGRDRVERVIDLFRLAMAEKAERATALGYVPVPKTLATQIETYWSTTLSASVNN